MLHISGQVAGKLGQRFSLGLAHIEYRYHLEHGYLDFFFLHNGLAVLVQNRRLGVRIALDFLHLFLIGRGRNNLDTLFTAFHMAAKLIAPLVETGYLGGVRFLHMNEHYVVDGVMMESGHDAEVLHIFVALKQVFDTLLNAFGDFPQSFSVALLLICHDLQLLSFWP